MENDSKNYRQYIALLIALYLLHFWEVLLNTICFKQQNYLFWGNRSQCFPKINNCKCILAITATLWAQLLQILDKIAIFTVKKLNKCMW